MPAILESTSDSHKTVTLDKPILFVGRHPDCDLIINKSRKVSRKHCCLIEVEGRFLVRDLGSTNGIQINNRRVTGLKELVSGDELTIGDCVFIFRSAEAIQKAKQSIPAAKKDILGGDAPHSFKPEIAPIPDHELSSDIPILLDESDDDGFDIGVGPLNPVKEVPRKRRKRSRSDSDSQVEMIAD